MRSHRAPNVAHCCQFEVWPFSPNDSSAPQYADSCGQVKSPPIDHQPRKQMDRGRRVVEDSAVLQALSWIESRIEPARRGTHPATQSHTRYDIRSTSVVVAPLTVTTSQFPCGCQVQQNILGGHLVTICFKPHHLLGRGGECSAAATLKWRVLMLHCCCFQKEISSPTADELIPMMFAHQPYPAAPGIYRH